MKICTVCLEQKPDGDFHFRNRAKGTRMNQCKKCGNARASKHYYDKGGFAFAKTRRKRHGMYYDDFVDQCERQEWKCLICNETSTKLVVDHDHLCCSGDLSCGKCVRGIICTHCNRGLGAFRDNPEYLMAAIAYLDA